MQRRERRKVKSKDGGLEAHAEAGGRRKAKSRDGGIFKRGGRGSGSGGNGWVICLPMAGKQQVLVIFIPVLSDMCDDYVEYRIIPNNFCCSGVPISLPLAPIPRHGVLVLSYWPGGHPPAS